MYRRSVKTAALIAAVTVPLALSAYLRARPRDYTHSAEFRALVGDFLI